MRHLAAFFFGVLLLVLVGCGYHSVGDGAARSGVSTVRIALLRNATLEPLVENVLTDEVVRELARQVALRVVADGEDAVLSGTVSDYRRDTLSYTAADDAARYRVTVSAKLQLVRTDDGTTVWKGTLTRHEDFLASTDSALEYDREADATRRACQRIAEDLYLHLVEDF